MQQQLEATKQQRDEFQRQLAEIADRYDAPEFYKTSLEQLRTQSANLHVELDETRLECRTLKRKLEEAENRSDDEVREAQAQLAAERAQVARLQHELSQKLSDIGELPEPENGADHEFALRLRSIRTELREINEQQQLERAEKGESLISRISGLWKRDDEF